MLPSFKSLCSLSHLLMSSCLQCALLFKTYSSPVWILDFHAVIFLSLASGILRGRPFGGVVTLINNRLRSITETVCCDERYSIVMVANHFIVNVYLPCVEQTVN